MKDGLGASPDNRTERPRLPAGIDLIEDAAVGEVNFLYVLPSAKEIGRHEVDRGGGFADAAFLISDSYDSAHKLFCISNLEMFGAR